MSAPRRLRWWIALAALVVLPSVARAEVSVQVDGQGRFKKVLTLRSFRGIRDGGAIWRQVRAGVDPRFLLNPLGDTYGDEAPVIQISPATGLPWAVWAKNFGNIKQLAFSMWDGRNWIGPALVNPGTPLVYSDRSPALAFDAFGQPYLVWARADQTGRIYFSTMVRGRWSPPVLLSNPDVASQAPSITLNGTTAVVTFKTPSGLVTTTYESAVLINSAASLMDNPIPPLDLPPPPVDPTGSGGPGGAQRN